MREILFRGKRTDNGEWAEGFYVCLPLANYDEKVQLITNAETGVSYEIIPETVGQYTGITDKNGKKIFEGDIVKTQPFYDIPYSEKRKSKQFIGVVKYRVRTFNGNKFYAKQDYHGEWGLTFYEGFGKYNHYSWGELWGCEIIGNIHDNPELLKEGADNGNTEKDC